jgi:hypothetical protein
MTVAFNIEPTDTSMKRYFVILCATAVLLPAWAGAQENGKKEPAKKIVVPFELIKTQHMVVNVKVNGKGPYRLVFDTGAPDSLVSNKIFKDAELTAKGGGLPLFGARGSAKIKTLEMGDLKAENISTMVMDHPTVQAIASFAGPLEGIIGFTFYSRYKMSIDYEKKEMTFEPNTYEPGDVMEMLVKKLSAPKSVREAPRILAPSALLGIRVAKEKDDEAAGVLVKEVMADSPAAQAGLKTGDRLLTLDGRWTDTIPDTYIAAGQLEPGRAVNAQITRDGKKMTVKLTVRAGL